MDGAMLRETSGRLGIALIAALASRALAAPEQSIASVLWIPAVVLLFLPMWRKP
jgi:hypothetical protein